MLGTNPNESKPLIFLLMKNTETQAPTLVERFTNAEEKVSQYHGGEEHRWYPERNRMQWELGRLLSLEAEGFCLEEEQLQEYKENFEWDTTYKVLCAWEIQPSTYTTGFECASAEEAREYLRHKKEIKVPEWKSEMGCSIEYGSGFTGDYSLEAEISVENLRLKKENQ